MEGVSRWRFFPPQFFLQVCPVFLGMQTASGWDISAHYPCDFLSTGPTSLTLEGVVIPDNVVTPHTRFLWGRAFLPAGHTILHTQRLLLHHYFIHFASSLVSFTFAWKALHSPILQYNHYYSLIGFLEALVKKKKKCTGFPSE